MNINFGAVLLATILQFIWGAVWYSAFFGKLWGKMHGFDKLSKEVQEKMMKEMGPIYGVQFLVTLVTTVVLAIFIAYQPSWNAYAMAGFFWIGFVVPTQVSGVIFGGTEGKWVTTKIAIQAGAALGCLEIAAGVLKMMG
ncbi:DUF1761 domain-containing protein [Candidatus Shapirobacteria bacterium]|nr:DUF1761 domain-containing protein [Candidatus Shapirobacteria bacterium]